MKILVANTLNPKAAQPMARLRAALPAAAALRLQEQ